MIIKSKSDCQASQRLDFYEGDQAEEIPANERISMLEQLKVKFWEGSDEGSESEYEDPYKPFNIMKQKRYSRPSKIKHFSKLSNELPHFKDVNVSKKHEYSERKSQVCKINVYFRLHLGI